MPPPSRLFLAAATLVATASANAAVQTYDDNNALNTWNLADQNWDSSTTLWSDGNDALFGGTAESVAVGSVTANSLRFDTAGYALTGGTITLTGTSGINTNNVGTTTIGSVLAGTVGMTKSGAGTLLLTGANSYTGNTTVSAGTLTFSGTGSLNPTTGGTLNLGGGSGNRAVLNMDSSGTIKFGGGTNIGGAAANDGGAGAINQTAGTVSLSNSGNYVGLGFGGYGSYVISGGTLTSSGGLRVGDNTGGQGSFLQTGGTVTLGRYLVVGGNTNNPAAVGVATISGGTLTAGGGYGIILGDGNGGSKGTLNIGTQAGGTGSVTMTTANFKVGGNAANTGILNFNSGTLTTNTGMGFAGANSVVNFNGGTFKIGSNVTTLINTGAVLKVYNGGVTLDTQSFDTTIAANLTGTTGNGIYTAGGVIANSLSQGAGYIGAPIVTVSGGSGTGATAIANVSNGQVTGVTLTSPGQNYTAGDQLTFALSGGGASTSIANFTYTLKASDLVANATGGLTKLGSGTLTLSGTNTYTGATAVNAGTLALATTGVINVGASGVAIAAGATLTLTGNARLELTSGASTIDNLGIISGSGILDLNGLFDGYGDTSYSLMSTGTDISGLTLAVTGFDTSVFQSVSFNNTNGNLDFVFTAVPEPSTYGLIGAGALAAVAMVRRRRKGIAVE